MNETVLDSEAGALAEALPGASVVVRRFAEADRAAVVELLSDTIGALYPGGREWLPRRLDDVVSGGAEAFVAWVGGSVVGVVILTPKAARVLKMSTLFVHGGSRGQGVGRHLVAVALRFAARGDFSETYVTVAQHLAGQLWPVLRPYGFGLTAVVEDRYGPGRTEVVYARLT